MSGYTEYVPPPEPEFSANAGSLKTGDIPAVTYYDGEIIITAKFATGAELFLKVKPLINNETLQPWALSPGNSSNVLTFKENPDSAVFSTASYPGGDAGTSNITFTTFEKSQAYISGTFSAKVYRKSDNKTVSVKGKFTGLPYKTDRPNRLSAFIDRKFWEATDITYYDNPGNTMTLSASSKSGTRISFIIPKDIKPDSISITPDSKISISFSDGGDNSFVTKEGSMVIISHDQGKKKMIAAFQFATRNQYGLTERVTGGDFTLFY